MVELVLVGFVAGILAGVSPCILPVLPVVLVAGATQPAGSSRGRIGLGRSLSVIAGLVLSFSLLILVGSQLISLLHLPQDSLRYAGIALLALVGLGYLFPRLGLLLERPFSRLGTRKPGGNAGGFVLGMALGLVYVPCAGPVLAAITVLGATHRVGLEVVVLTAAFAAGTAVPLLAIALAGGHLSGRTGAFKRHAPLVRRIGGVVLVVMAGAIALDVFAGLQRLVPGYSTALQGSQTVRKQLSTLTGAAATPLTKCSPTATTLVSCGQAPAFTGVTAWLNTPDGKPLSLRALRGKVVLVDFWTYSCINCQRTLPHVETWYREYAKDGFVVVGVHTPEFAFEHVVSNVRSQGAALGVRYPVAIDDRYATWNAYHNEYWPAEYLIDANGNVRHVHFGEGDYGTTEQLIRQLLVAARPGVRLAGATNVSDRTPAGQMSPETYIGYERLQYLVPPGGLVKDAAARYRFPASLPLGGFALSGTWTDHAQEATAGKDAKLELSFLAQEVYLVLGGRGSLDVIVDGHHVKTIHVAGVPRLYPSITRASRRAAGSCCALRLEFRPTTSRSADGRCRPGVRN
jgi:cytochrome c biogenesis protein CcdA/thiol-disulfide isomerase/thioredoxin